MALARYCERQNTLVEPAHAAAAPDKFQIAGRNGFHFFPFAPQVMQERAMSFNTTSYLAGVGTVVAALTIGFSGGLFLAPPTEHVENRLQRVTSGAPLSTPTSQEAITPKPEITPARSIELIAAKVPAPSTQQPARAETVPVMANAVEPARAAPDENAAKPDVNMEKMRAAEAKAERKRAREQRRAERRKQREIEFSAAKQMLRNPAPQQVADRTESPRFGFFGED